MPRIDRITRPHTFSSWGTVALVWADAVRQYGGEIAEGRRVQRIQLRDDVCGTEPTTKSDDEQERLVESSDVTLKLPEGSRARNMYMSCCGYNQGRKWCPRLRKTGRDPISRTSCRCLDELDGDVLDADVITYDGRESLPIWWHSAKFGRAALDTKHSTFPHAVSVAADSPSFVSLTGPLVNRIKNPKRFAIALSF
jgi:hypothetical protein